MAGESKQYRFPVHISGGREARHKRRRGGDEEMVEES